MKDRFFGLFLMLCLIAPLATTYLVLKVQKRQVKKEVKWKMINGLDKQELVLLKFSEKEKQKQLKWKHSKEFEYQGEMYDVVDTEVNGDSTFYWCWWDYEETDLNKRLTALLTNDWNDNPINRENKNKLFQFYKSLYFSGSIQNELCHIQDLNNGICIYNFGFKSYSIAPKVPPPEVA